MPFDVNQIVMELKAEVDEQDFNEIDRRLKKTADVAKSAEKAVGAIPLPFDPVPMEELDKASKRTSANLRLVQLSLGSVGGEAAATTTALISAASNMKTASSGLGKGAGVATAAVLALGLAIVKVTSDINKQTAIMDAQIEAQTRYFDILATGTTETATAQIEQSQDILRAREGELENLNFQIAKAKEIVSESGLVGQAANELFEVLTGTPLEALEARQQQTEVIIKRENETIDSLTGAIERNAFAANDAAAAQEAQAESAAKAAEVIEKDLIAAQEKMIDSAKKAVREAEATAKQSAKAARDASKATSAAIADQRKVNMESVIADKKSSQEALEFAAEQEEELNDLRDDNRKAQIKAEKDFNKDIKQLVEEQSFIAAINRQDGFVEAEQERRDAAKEGIAELRVELEEERIVEQLAAEKEREDRLKGIQAASADVAKAQRNEAKLKRTAANDALKLQHTRAEQEIALQSQVNKVQIANLKSVVEFAIITKSQVDKALGRTGGGLFERIGAGAKVAMSRSEVRGIVLDSLDKVMG